MRKAPPAGICRQAGLGLSKKYVPGELCPGRHGPGFLRRQTPWCSRAAVRVFSMSMALVMGPTPPGTGVM